MEHFADAEFRQPEKPPLCAYVLSVLTLFLFAGRYLHPMATARTFATSDVWGSDPTSPAAAWSSPLGTLLVAGSRLASPVEAFPYVALP
jgi:hypothetical protein